LELIEAALLEENTNHTVEVNSVIVEMLRASMAHTSFAERLEALLLLILEIPWLSLEKKGCVFITDNTGAGLTLVASHNLSSGLLDMCSHIKFDQCLCGRAAATQALVFRDCVGDDHTNTHEGMQPHGHYNIPIVKNNKTLGVLNLYVKEGHVSTELERDFLTVSAEVLAQLIDSHNHIEFEKRQFKSIIDTALDGIITINSKGIILAANNMIAKVFGYSIEELMGQNVSLLMGSELARHHDQYLADYLETGQTKIIGKGREVKAKHRDGHVFDIHLSVVELKPQSSGGEPIFSGIIRDLTDTKQEQIKLLESEKKYKTLFEESIDAMLILDGGMFVDCNDAAVEMLGYSNKGDLLKAQSSEFSPLTQPDGQISSEKANEMIKKAFKHGNIRFEWEHLRKNGEVFPVEVSLTAITIDGEQQLHTVWRDLTDKKEAEAKIQELANEDSLTGLPNRRTLADRLIHILDIYKRTHNKGALLFIDLDHFKNVNDTLGHDVGDELLKQVAKRLVGAVRVTDTVSRFGGDEFVVMLEDLNKDATQAAGKAKTACEKLLSDLNRPYILRKHEVSVSASIGVSMFSEDSLVVDLLKQSDIAMYQAKASGRNAVRFFDPKMQQVIDERANVEQLIKDSVSNNLFELHYQLQVNESGKPLGVEGLLRLKHPEKGSVPPMTYIPVAEEIGLILHIGNFVLETACEQLKKWEGNAKTSTLSVAINVSPIEFKADSFVMNVLAAIQNHNINPALLKFELTESLLLDNVDDVIEKMNLLKENGVQFSMDDFGRGYSSLQYLRQLPLDQLKIDQSFVRDLEHDEQDRSIVKTIIAMGHGLGLNVIAEGVENTKQQDMLMEYGCSNYQGYLFAKPLPVDEVEKLLLAK